MALIALFASLTFVGSMLTVFWFASLWKMFERAGNPGWACFVPFYNAWKLARSAGKPGWYGIVAAIVVFRDSNLQTPQSPTAPSNTPATVTLSVVAFLVAVYVISLIFYLSIAIRVANRFGEYATQVRRYD